MLSFAPFSIEGRRVLLLAGSVFSPVEAKTAVCYVMYRGRDVVAVHRPGKPRSRVDELLGFGGGIPVVDDIDEALGFAPEVAIVGTAPTGGTLNSELREHITACLRGGVDVVSGMHAFLEDDEALARIAQESGARIWDVRRVEGQQRVSSGAGCTTGARVVAVVGSDCNVGKMTVSIELDREAARRGLRSAWAATGQTGMMLRGRGVAVDRVIADFVGGATEELVNEEGRNADIVFVEGQGSIVHPGYAGVTLGLIYGAQPDAFVLAHTADREHFKRFDDIPVPPLPELIDLHERLMRPFKPARVVAIAVNTSCFDEDAARAFLAGVENETGRPATDVVRFGCGPIIDSVIGGNDKEQI